MSNPVDILICAVTSLLFFLIIYPVFHADVLILGLVLVGRILLGQNLYLF